MSMSPRHEVDPDADRTDADLAPTAPSRRQFVRSAGLGAAALGAAALTGVVATGAASAQTTTEPPDLVPSDVELVQFLQSISLAAETALMGAIDLRVLSSPRAEEVRTFAAHHRDHAKTLGALLSEEEAITEPNPTLLAATISSLSAATADERAMLTALYEFESQLAATMLAAIGEAVSFVVSGPIASVQPVVGQQAAAFGQAADLPESEWMPSFSSSDGALTPAADPVR